jgi:hypothetical protein
MVILEVGFESPRQLPLIEHDHSIQAFTSNRTHQPLDVGVLPGRAWGDQLLLDAHPLKPLHEGRAVKAIPIPQQILGRGFVREGVDDLLGRPLCGRRLGDIEMNDLRRSCVIITNT